MTFIACGCTTLGAGIKVFAWDRSGFKRLFYGPFRIPLDRVLESLVKKSILASYDWSSYKPADMEFYQCAEWKTCQQMVQGRVPRLSLNSSFELT